MGSADLPPRVAAAWKEVNDAWERLWSASRAQGLPALPSGRNRFRLTLRFPGESYRVNCELTRRCGKLLDVWQRHVAGRPAFRSGTLTVLRVGILRDFGDLLDPPVDQRLVALARRFKKPVSTVRSYLQRYRRITADRSVR